MKEERSQETGGVIVSLAETMITRTVRRYGPQRNIVRSLNDFVRYSRRLRVMTITASAATFDDNFDDVIDQSLRFHFILFELQMQLMQTHNKQWHLTE